MSGRRILFIGSGREAKTWALEEGLRPRDVRAVNRPGDLVGYRSEDVEVQIGHTADYEAINEAYRRGMIE